MTSFKDKHIFSGFILLPTSTHFKEHFVFSHFQFILLPLGGQSGNNIKQGSDFLLFCLNNTVLQNRIQRHRF
jgi:hypothetical protein